MNEKIHQVPLRPRKQAQTKLALMNAALEAVAVRPLEQVTVRELCEAAQVSEPTFFNYFSAKADVLVHFIRLWSLEMGWHARRTALERGAMAAVEDIFLRTFTQAAGSPGLMAEIVAVMARMDKAPPLDPIPAVERWLRFPELEGIEDLEPGGLETLLPPLLALAAKQGELPQDMDQQGAFLSLCALFFGLSVLLRQLPPQALRETVLDQLSILWAGLRARPELETSTRKEQP
ncbi:MAG: TetR/AcrR family transcriptional regulator [Deltaproteobacteria bacterium]|nr:TetR/AcrR family transcriptional regulator [Deltaproteobacteria bacterium]